MLLITFFFPCTVLKKKNNRLIVAKWWGQYYVWFKDKEGDLNGGGVVDGKTERGGDRFTSTMFLTCTSKTISPKL